jgi:hypothetical protein
MATTGTVNTPNGSVKIDLDGESGRLWLEGAGAAMRLKRASQSYNFCRKQYGARDPRTIEAKAQVETARIAADAAEIAFKTFAGI